METVGIIIINYQDYARKYLTEFWESLQKVDYPYQLFIVDQESSAESRQFLLSIVPQATIIPTQENLGYAGGMNTGFAKVKEQGLKNVLFANFDLVMEPTFLTELVKVLESDLQIGAVQSRVMLYPQTDQVNSLGNSIHYLGFGFSAGGYQKLEAQANLKPFEITYASGVTILMRTELFEQIGKFQNDFFMYHEDLDLGWKLRLAGYKIVLAPASVVYHKFKFSTSMRQYYWMERNRFITTLKNYKLATLLVFSPMFFLMELGQLIFALKNRTFITRLKVYSQFFQPVFWREIMAGRKFIKEIRKTKDKEILKYFVGEIKFQEIDNWLLKYIANPVMHLYFSLAKWVIWW